jgi:hypothetical protein
MLKLGEEQLVKLAFKKQPLLPRAPSSCSCGDMADSIFSWAFCPPPSSLGTMLGSTEHGTQGMGHRAPYLLLSLRHRLITNCIRRPARYLDRTVC